MFVNPPNQPPQLALSHWLPNQRSCHYTRPLLLQKSPLAFFLFANDSFGNFNFWI